MKIYGSLNNRMDENKMYCKQLEKGTGATMYYYSDRKAYEITRIINQEHVFIRKMKAIRIDNNGMSESQDYRFESQEDSPEIEIIKKNDYWCEVKKYTKENIIAAAKRDISFFRNIDVAYTYYVGIGNFTESQRKRLEEGKEVKKYTKINISFGVQDEYFDYSF